jgi:CHAD domain-containing protein
MEVLNERRLRTPEKGLQKQMTVASPDQGSLEREVKLKADPDFVIPSLAKGVGAFEWRCEQHLRTAYFDTAEFRLWRRSITLRHRLGEESGAGTWTLKLPAPSEGPLLTRSELTWTGSRVSVPDDAARLLLGITRRSPLRQVVELVTTRRRLMLLDSSGMLRGELDDDTVTVVGGDRNGVCFRQIELEIGQGGEALVDPVVKTLMGAGARQDGEQKLAKGVDLPDRSAGDSGVLVDRDSTVGDVVKVSIATALNRLLDNDYLLRIEPANPSVEGVHQARVATRRLRSELKMLGSALDGEWVHHIRRELQWLGAVLGQVRDADVLAPLLEGDGDGSAFDRDGRKELRARLDGQRRTHCGELALVLIDSRYLTLLDRLDEATRRPPFDDHRSGKSNWSSLSERPARAILPELVGLRWKALRKMVREAGRHPSDRDLHGMRIRSKELRYAAETAAPVIGKAARRTATAAEAAQSVLGEHHDAVGAEFWLRSQAMEGPLGASYSAGRAAAERVRLQRKLRHRWRSVWRELDRKKLRRWFQVE